MIADLTPQLRLEAIKLAKEILDAEYQGRKESAAAQYQYLLQLAASQNQPPPQPFSPVEAPTVDQVLTKANGLIAVMASPL